MSPATKSLLVGGIGGALIGSGITYIITKTILTKKHKQHIEDINTIISALKKQYGDDVDAAKTRAWALEEAIGEILTVEEEKYVCERANELMKGPKTPSKPDTDDIPKEVVTMPNDPRPIVPKITPEPEEGIEPAPANPDKEWDPDEEITGEIKVVEEQQVIHPREAPYLITEDEYGDSDNELDTLVYYEEDGVLSTENEEVLDIDDTVGQDAIDKLVNGSDTIVYARNNHLGLDYEVRIEYNSYARTCLGIDYGRQYDDEPARSKIRRRNGMMDEL